MMIKHVVSVDIARILDQRCWSKVVMHYWFYDKYTKKWRLIGHKRTGALPAPLATEILEVLPAIADPSHPATWLHITKRQKGYYTYYEYPYSGRAADENSLPDALAQIWIKIKGRRYKKGSDDC